MALLAFWEHADVFYLLVGLLYWGLDFVFILSKSLFLLFVVLLFLSGDLIISFFFCYFLLLLSYLMPLLLELSF